SSWQHENPPAAALDEDETTRWSAASSGADQSLDIDLAQKQSLKCIVIEFEREAKNYGYSIETSDDRSHWQSCVTQSPSTDPPWGGPRTAVHDVDSAGRHARLRVN